MGIWQQKQAVVCDKWGCNGAALDFRQKEVWIRWNTAVRIAFHHQSLNRRQAVARHHLA